jgi:BASS family bile acid:Na+ symporter
MKPGLIRVAALLLAIVLGSLLPQMHVLSWCIRWLIIAMLFIVFLEARLWHQAFQRRHGLLLLANIAMGIVAWSVGWLVGGRDVALAAFFTGISPTATAAPVVIGLLRGRVEYTATAFMLTNLVIAGLMPFLLPVVLGHPTPAIFARISGSVCLVIFMPMLVAWTIRALHARAAEWPSHLRSVSFGIWVVAIFLLTADASNFLHTQAVASHPVLFKIAAVTLLVCAANFSLGRLIGGRDLSRECSQSLGQKNTVFTIFLALTYGSPLIALGPTFYVIWHNLWNAWQLHRAVAHSDPREHPTSNAQHRTSK